MKQTILDLLENNELAEKISNNGFDFVMNNLTWEVLLPKYIKFYKNLINS